MLLRTSISGVDDLDPANINLIAVDLVMSDIIEGPSIRIGELSILEHRH
jgi:hypothetical protein